MLSILTEVTSLIIVRYGTQFHTLNILDLSCCLFADLPETENSFWKTYIYKIWSGIVHLDQLWY
jgi:hypothetical protein